MGSPPVAAAGFLEGIEAWVSSDNPPDGDDYVAIVTTLVTLVRLLEKRLDVVEGRLDTVLNDAECGNYVPPWEMVPWERKGGF